MVRNGTGATGNSVDCARTAHVDKRWVMRRACGAAGKPVFMAAALLLALISGREALAQISEPPQRPEMLLEPQISEPQAPGRGVPEVAPALPERPKAKYSWDTNLTGDWGGLRNTLSADYGIEITAGYAMEFMGNPVGGRQNGATYVHNILLGLDVDLDKLIGLPHSAFRVRGSQRSGDSLSKDYIGNAFSVQQLYGGGQTWRLVEMQLFHDLFDGRFNLTYGRLAATDDFLTSPLYCQFVSNAICGQPPSPFFNLPDGITAYPAAVWGVRGRVKPTPDTYVQVGVYDGQVDQEGRNDHGTDFGFGSNGVLVLTEAGYKPDQGLLGLPAAYKIGGYYHSGDFTDVGDTVTPGVPPRQFQGGSGVYALVDQMLYRERPADTEGLYGLLVFVAAPDQSQNSIPYFFSAGLIYEGLIDARPKDKAAFAVANGQFSDRLRRAQRRAGLEQQHSETILELNYQIQLTEFAYFRPDIQYVVQPNGIRDIDNALALGFEAGMEF
jgi:porin